LGARDATMFVVLGKTCATLAIRGPVHWFPAPRVKRLAEKALGWRLAKAGASDNLRGMSPNLEQALQLIREDRPEAVEQALALLQNTVYSFSMKVCGHPEDAEDTMQEVLVKLLPYLPRFDSPQALSVWLYKVARNRCLMSRRGAKNSRSKHVSLDELMPSHYELQELIESKDPNPETNVLRGESNLRLREAVLKVPPLYRMVLVLHDMEGLNTSEVARVAGLREGTVRVRLHRARLLLRQQLARMAKAKGVVAQIHAAADDVPKRPQHCREMFAALSDYMDGLVEDTRSREMEKHLDECKPCVAFLDSLKSAVEQCRTYEPVCDTARAEELRKELVEKYQAAVAALSNVSA
jgi:RNA polymerase sigma-70 factor, ECF subfamily